MKAGREFAATVAGDFAVPSTTEAFEPFDEQLAQMRLKDQLEELDYSDLVLDGDLG